MANYSTRLFAGQDVNVGIDVPRRSKLGRTMLVDKTRIRGKLGVVFHIIASIGIERIGYA